MPTLPDSAKLLPSAALGKDHSAKKQPAFCQALGKAFAGALGKEKHSANKKILEK